MLLRASCSLNCDTLIVIVSLRPLLVNWRKATGIRITMIQNASVFDHLAKLAGFFGGVGMFGGIYGTVYGRELLQARHVRQMPKVLGVVEPVPDEKLVRRVEPDEAHGMIQVGGDVLVEQGADLERFRLALAEQSE